MRVHSAGSSRLEPRPIAELPIRLLGDRWSFMACAPAVLRRRGPVALRLQLSPGLPWPWCVATRNANTSPFDSCQTALDRCRLKAPGKWPRRPSGCPKHSARASPLWWASP